MTFEIARSEGWRWLLAMFGATARRSTVELDGEQLDVRFGFFHERIHLADVARVEVGPKVLPWYRWSLGWRSNLLDTVALVGAPRDFVRLDLKRSRGARLALLPVRYHTLFISMTQPEAFAAAVNARLSGGEASS